ncbi:MAG TPA: hypothetical protein VF148_08965 [Acidimicrobiia bacterium]
MNYALLYLEHLSEQDLRLIARKAGRQDGPSELSAVVRDHPEIIEDVLSSPELSDAIFSDESEAVTPGVTPFLVFGALVHQTARELDTANYVPEWTGPGRRLPVFDVTPLREFLNSGANRFFLIELLASFVKVASGSIWVRTRKGYRRRRFSELDPVQLAEMVEMLPPRERPGGYRRLGDVVLFLSGVFPDHTATHPPALPERERLVASAGVAPVTALADGTDLRFHEIVGANWYRRAVESAQVSVGSGPGMLLEVADHFSHARRFLNVLADRHLFRYESGLMRPSG